MRQDDRAATCTAYVRVALVTYVRIKPSYRHRRVRGPEKGGVARGPSAAPPRALTHTTSTACAPGVSWRGGHPTKAWPCAPMVRGADPAPWLLHAAAAAIASMLPVPSRGGPRPCRHTHASHLVAAAAMRRATRYPQVQHVYVCSSPHTFRSRPLAASESTGDSRTLGSGVGPHPPVGPPAASGSYPSATASRRLPASRRPHPGTPRSTRHPGSRLPQGGAPCGRVSDRGLAGRPAARPAGSRVDEAGEHVEVDHPRGRT